MLGSLASCIDSTLTILESFMLAWVFNAQPSQFNHPVEINSTYENLHFTTKQVSIMLQYSLSVNKIGTRPV